MRKAKRLISLLLAVLMALSVCSFACAEEDKKRTSKDPNSNISGSFGIHETEVYGKPEKA